jgi:RNA polymerase sigma-70 factor (ECF subfamily)
MRRPSWFRRPASEATPGSSSDAEVALIWAAKGDHRHFAPLYDRHVDDVYRYCLRRLGTKEAAEDATAQIFVKALAALPSYREDAPSFRSWLFAIAHNTIVDAYRQRRPDTSLDEALARPDPGPGPVEAAESAEDLALLRALLAQLTEDQRSLIELRLAGLSDAEIAVATGRDRKAVNAAQYRALRRLRTLHDTASSDAGRGRRG